MATTDSPTDFPTGRSTERAIGVDLGGTNTRVALVAPDGTVVAERRHPTDTASADGLVTVIADAVGDLVAAAGGRTPVGVGVGVAALVDREGVAHCAPNVAALEGLDVRGAVTAATGLDVVVDNDANVAAWGELAHGAAVGARDALLLTLGTGVGGAIVIDGKVHRGAHGFAAEVGHWRSDPDGPLCACGVRGHWEAQASGTALGRLAQDAARRGDAPQVLARAGGDPERVTGHDVSAGAVAGEADALALLDAYADAVALGVAGLTAILDPEIVVISGGLVTLGDLLLDRVRARVPAHLEGAAVRPPLPVVAATLGDAAGVVGAAVLARRTFGAGGDGGAAA